MSFNIKSEPVFARAHLLGIKLMPRIRNWKDLIFYRPDEGTKYQHIDALFTDHRYSPIILTGS
jgi:TnpA family transposase